MSPDVLRTILLGLLLIFSFASEPVNAQATRTWVSGVGDDADPCSRTAPCKTFAGAISKTQANGEIDCLDPGGFGAVTITKAITIDCSGTFGSVLVSGTNAIVVSAGAGDKVTLRGLSINGVGTGLDGIRFLTGAQLDVEQCALFGFTGSGIDVNTTTASIINIANTSITNVGRGVFATSSVAVGIFLDKISILRPGANGFEAQNHVAAVLTNTTIATAGNSAVIASGASQISVDSSTLFSSTTAINASTSGASIFVSNSNIYSNATNFSIAAGGAILSSGNNRTTPAGGANPSGSITLK